MEVKKDDQKPQADSKLQSDPSKVKRSVPEIDDDQEDVFKKEESKPKATDKVASSNQGAFMTNPDISAKGEASSKKLAPISQQGGAGNLFSTKTAGAGVSGGQLDKSPMASKF